MVIYENGCLGESTISTIVLILLQPSSFSSTEGSGVPTSIDFIRTETSQMVAAYSSAQCVIYDLETAAPVVALDSAKTYSKWTGYMLGFQCIS